MKIEKYEMIIITCKPKEELGAIENMDKKSFDFMSREIIKGRTKLTAITFVKKKQK